MYDFKIDNSNIRELIRCMNILNEKHDFRFDVCAENNGKKWFFCIDVRPKNKDCQWDVFVRVIGKDLINTRKEFYKLINNNIIRVMNYDAVSDNMFSFFRLVKYL